MPDTGPLQASVIVVSRHRAASLVRCLVALSQQDHPCLEVVVVADPAGIAAVQAAGLVVKLVGFDQPNISAARNMGLAVAAAPVVAFLDDDAVAEPTWLRRLTAPFAQPDVVAATGFVRGRNGISFQWRAARIDAQGHDHPFEVPEEGGVFPSGPTMAVKTVGTNCAFRANALRSVGGFDPAFRFYLDESDVNLRMAHLGLTALVPLAQVHHGYEASDQRLANRVPTDLRQIGASTAVFVRRHAPQDQGAVLHAMQAREQERLDRHHAAGRLTMPQLRHLSDGLLAGWAEGLLRPLTPTAPMAQHATPFLQMPGTGPRKGLVLAGRRWSRPRLEREAAKASHDSIVTVYCLSPTPRRHSVRFDPRGFWIHRGGQFGQFLRQGSALILNSFGARVCKECNYWAKYRPMTGGDPPAGKFKANGT